MSRILLPNRCWATCLWPGLPQLYLRGAFSGLIVAFGFAALFNLLVATSLVWTDLATPLLRTTGWGLMALIWTIAAVVSRRTCREHAESGTESREASGRDLFEGVIDDYLKGNWYEVETRLREILRRFPRDAEAHLLLATMFRHTDRHDEAIRRLDELTRWETCEEWRVEIARERELLSTRHRNRAVTSDQQTTAAEPAENAKAA